MRRVYLSALAVFLLDQASKFVMLHVLRLSERAGIDVLPPLLRFRYGENRGINFGLLGDAPDLMRWVLIAFSLVVVAAVYWWVRRFSGDFWMTLSAGFLIGGALGNVLDRLLYGYVIDFLNMSCCGIDNPYVFNLADVFIFAGAIGLVVFEGRAKGKNPS